ncbi:MAG: hypothetical protein ACTSRE_01125 [Promethearchaeota archaeon]
MKRIQSLDIIRGIAMLGLVFMHAYQKVGYNTMAHIFDYPWYVVATLGIILYFASWRGFFLIISGVGSAYSFQKAVENGKSPHILLLKRTIWSIILFLWGITIQIFWNPYNGFYRVFFGQTGIDVINIGGLGRSDAVEIIAIGLFITTLVHYILVLTKARKKKWISILVNLLLCTVVFASTNLLKGWESLQNLELGSITSFGSAMRHLLHALLIGTQEPLFPYLATFFLGIAIGIFLTTPKATKKNMIYYGLGLGGAIIIVAVLVGVFTGFPFAFSILPDMWFLLLGTGIQVWVLMIFLWIFDFSKRAKKLTKYTKIVRKAGILSLTIFTLQAIDFVPRFILTGLSSTISSVYGTGTAVDFLSNGGNYGMGAAFLAAFTVLFFWIGIIALWEKINYALTFDWIFKIFRQSISCQKINWKDPLMSKEIICNPEIVFEREIKNLEKD